MAKRKKAPISKKKKPLLEEEKPLSRFWVILIILMIIATFIFYLTTGEPKSPTEWYPGRPYYYNK